MKIMKHNLRLLMLTLLCAVFGTALGETKSVTISPTQALNDGGVSPITIVCAKGDGSSNPAISNGQLRLYQAGSGKTTGNTITFSSENTIKTIVFTFANDMTASNGSFSVGSYDSSTSTWTGSTNSVTLTVTGTTTGKRIYITNMVVYYEESGSQSPIDPTISLDVTDIKVGKTTAISFPSDLSDVIYFESSDEDVATVDEDGVITGVGAGEATITVTWDGDSKYNEGEATFTVTVSESTGTVFVEVEDASQLVAGNEYIIVSPEYNVAMGAPNANNNKIRDAVTVTIENDEVSISDEAVAILTLGGSDGAWTFYASDTQNYLALNASSNEVHSAAEVTDNAKWTITSDFELQNNTYSTRILKYNSGSPRFACYSSSQKPAYLFVKQGGQTNTKSDPNLSFGTTTSFTVYVGGDFTAPALINPYNLEGITYESSDDDIASVDPETGEVTIGNTEGEVTITASFAGNDVYNEGSASYTITVSKASQELTVNNAPTSMLVGESIELDWTSNSGNSVSITTSDANVIELDESVDGLLHAVGAGTATIKVSMDETEAYKADEVSFTVTVIDPTSSKAFVKVTNLNQVVAGNKYILVTEGGIAMGAQDGNYRKEVEVSLVDGIAYVSNDVAVLTLGGKAGAWTFSPSDTDGELSFASDDNNNLVTKTDATDAEKLWRISNDFQVWHRAFPARTIQDNTGYNHFGCFRNTQAPSYLYVQQGSDIDENYKKDPLLSITNAFLELGSGPKKPKVNTPSNGNITYSGFDSDIVTFTDGNMQAVAEGTTTVTATLEATAEYEGDVTTFTITVVPEHSNMASHLYKKVTSNADLTAGKYLIVYEEGSVAFNGGLTTLDAAGNVIDVTISDDKIFCEEDAYFLIDPEAGTIHSASGLYIGITGTSNGLKTSKDADAYTNDISIDDYEDAVIIIGTMTLRFNKDSGQNRFRYFKSGQQAIQLYKAVDPFSFEILEDATDGTDHYATISALGSEKYYQVSGGAEVFTLTVDNNKLVFSTPFTDGDVIPSNGAYLVRGVPGDYEFTAAPDPENPVDISENMLFSTGNGENGITAEEMDAAHTDPGYKFYKLAYHLITRMVGFFWGKENGAPFNCFSGHQAYLAVPPSENAGNASAFFFDGTTAISEVVSESSTDNTTYTLSGIRVDSKNLPKGIYIVNGNKVVIK